MTCLLFHFRAFLIIVIFTSFFFFLRNTFNSTFNQQKKNSSWVFFPHAQYYKTILSTPGKKNKLSLGLSSLVSFLTPQVSNVPGNYLPTKLEQNEMATHFPNGNPKE